MKFAKRALAILMSFTFLFAFGFVAAANPPTECYCECVAFPGCDGYAAGCSDCLAPGTCTYCDPPTPTYDCLVCNDAPGGCPECNPPAAAPNCATCGDAPTAGTCYCCDICGLPCCEIYAPGAPAFCTCDDLNWWQQIVQVLRVFTDWVANGLHGFFQFLGWLMTPIHWFLRYVIFGWMFM